MLASTSLAVMHVRVVCDKYSDCNARRRGRTDSDQMELHQRRLCHGHTTMTMNRAKWKGQRKDERIPHRNAIIGRLLETP
ncbi:hypothetical protein SeMB42_g06351 [Synchytrium endobioticum]|uniref:Uncharacterized protein n=1 Tax=Synchytrium endobioticum TaxID=286115 RepID=A0A507CD86_9FUNG|nr:hypothetical protein SeMB42_g06351 [Synchytrium endobioticum]